MEGHNFTQVFLGTSSSFSSFSSSSSLFFSYFLLFLFLLLLALRYGLHTFTPSDSYAKAPGSVWFCGNFLSCLLLLFYSFLMSSCVYLRGWLITMHFFKALDCIHVSLKFADLSSHILSSLSILFVLSFIFFTREGGQTSVSFFRSVK